jgi:hypothetical protein
MIQSLLQLEPGWVYGQPSGRWGVTAVGFAAAAASVAIVTTVSIDRGPSAYHAALIIHRTHQQVAKAREASPGVAPSAFQEAEAALSSARIALAKRRYEAAIAAAITAKESVVREIAANQIP